ncbi:MAG: hypothetical protein H8D96_12220 [Desulfobacterales bacterium]|uniref:Uncharacterized protein n=1 Tax=Candidatus Desulfatibia vada TaxID=2841696 RepID=A0A8J6NZ44_9BACT|nr:hypothetical protein [Candidatus Desulfatibia vada]MBL7218112.1 hypothetical protein [Desulfobacteraceae bacterium]
MAKKPVQYHQGGFPPKRLDWERLVSLIGPANAALARYDGMLAAVPNPAVYAYRALLNISEGMDVF